MLLPLIRLRRHWLQRALREYPLYDPPHKIEERLLSREKADENFQYFMRVRQDRVANFKKWLSRNFRVAITPDESGVRALNRWGNKYAGLLLPGGPDGRPTDSYFSYDPPWTGENAAYNALFDLGMTFGEIAIGVCPNLRWDVDPLSAILPRTARSLRQSPGTSFQRPMLAGFDDPAGGAHPLHEVWGFAHQMLVNLTTVEGYKRYRHLTRAERCGIRNQLLAEFRRILRSYSGDLKNAVALLRNMSPKEYLDFIDRVENEKEGDDGE